MSNLAWFFCVVLLVGCEPAGSGAAGGAGRPVAGVTAPAQSGLTPWQPVGELDCHAELSATAVGLLSPVDLTVRVFCQQADELPIAKQVFEGFDQAVEVQIDKRAPGWLHTIVYHLRPTSLGDDGELTIPSLVIQDGEATVTTPELNLTILSALAEEHDKVKLEADDLLPPLTVWWPYVVAGSVLSVLVLLLVMWVRRPRPERALPVEVPVPPHVKAMRALQRLRQAPCVTETEIEAFYVEVSQVLRVYLEERFGLHAPTRSTEEFLVELEQGADLRLDHRQSLRNFLQQCDLVKFARLWPGTDIHQQTLLVAETVVEETRADLVGTRRSSAPPSRVVASGEGR